MKKIPTLFKREFHEDGTFTLTDQVTEGMEWVLDGVGLATVKWDGTPVYYGGIGQWYKRYDNKKRNQVPEGSIPCITTPDPITGHWPLWVPIDWSDPANGYICKAITNYIHYGSAQIVSGTTFEAIGPGINGNHNNYAQATLKYHGDRIITDFPRDFQRMGIWLSQHAIEGVVFWLNGEPMCKIKRSDFGHPWPLIFADGKDGETP